ncbi:MAG: FlgD immunoglobulin-like domain containing protein [Candidatus Eisenbacteria bacterium]
MLRALSLAALGSAALALFSLDSFSSVVHAEGPVLPHPILFVTQVPVPSDFTTVGSTFGNHVPTMQAAARGGDLWIRYEDGTLRNLTAAAGYGANGFQGDTAIAVREPSVHWDGDKALFSMVVGGPEQQYQWETYVWQIYEIEGLGPSDTPVITKVPNQPEGYNNVSPIYGSDDRILFTSDRPFNGAEHLYPQLDEYEEAPTVSGIWNLDPITGDLFLVEHSPSGSFSLELDSYGRLLFTRWDHLQRDQQADADEMYGDTYGTFNWSGEGADDIPLDTREEQFPEPRPSREDLLAGTNLVGHTFNHFFPWMIQEDGRGAETLNHVGRHELHVYFSRSLDDDPNLVDFNGNFDDRILNFFHVSESGTTAGTYYGIDAPEFYTHSAGQVVRVLASPTVNPGTMSVQYVTDRSTSTPSENPPPEHSGLYRNPLELSDGKIVSVHTPETRGDENDGSRAFPTSRYDFRIKTLVPDGTVWTADQALTPGITGSVSYYDPDVLVQYSGLLWELDPVEVRARPRPSAPAPVIDAPEAQIFAEENVAVGELEQFLRDEGLALVVSRNVTTRDGADEQQPYNLRVPGGTETIGSSGTVYDVSALQFFQGDLIRGIGGYDSPSPGRRVLAQAMHEGLLVPYPEGPLGSVPVAADGSIAAFVPARRALSWQTLAPDDTPVVRERYWLSFQPGEIRTCTSCHGVNQLDQAGGPAPTNPPEALRSLLQFYKTLQPSGIADEGAPGDRRPGDTRLLAAPNPFRESTDLRLDLTWAIRNARLDVFDAQGRVVTRIALGDLAAGDHVIPWNGGRSAVGSVAGSSDRGGDGRVPPGLYFARLAHAEGTGKATRLTVLP